MTAPRLRLLVVLVVLSLMLVLSIRGAAASGQMNGQGVLWRVTGGPAPSYLFGTMHVTDERVLRLAPEVFDAFDSCNHFVFELVIPPDGGLWSTVPLDGLPNNVTLSDLIGSEAYDRVVVHATRYGISTAELTRIHPLDLFSIFGQPPGEWQRSRQGWAFLDQALQNEARAQGKPVYALETIAEQLAVDNVLPEIDLSAAVIAMLDYSFQAEADFETLVQDYLARNITAVFEREAAELSIVSGKDRAIIEEYNRQSLDVRNIRMADRSVKFLNAGKAFIAVGAAHLPGETGLVNQIRLRGFEVERVY